MTRDWNAWIQTASGGSFWPLRPDAELVVVEDIATALSRIPRFAGHTIVPYYVAQHAVMVSREALREADARGLESAACLAAALWGLHHDDAEAYLGGDVPSPIKRSFQVGGRPYGEAEDAILAKVAERFDLPWPMPDAIAGVVKQADLVALATERRDLMLRPPREWSLDLPPPAGLIEPLDHAGAREAFLLRHRVLLDAWGQYLLIRQAGQ